MADLTVVILTKNEELNIAECINSVKSVAKRIIVIDSYSDDMTVDIASEAGAEIYKNKFISHSNQFKWGLDNIEFNTKWVLRIDADERLLHETSEEIEKMTAIHENDDINGFVFKTRIFFMGRWIKYGGIYPLKILRLFKYGKATIEDRDMDEHLVLLEGKCVELRNDLIHYDFKNLSHWTLKHNWYSTKEAKQYFSNKEAMKINKPTNIQAKFKRILKYNVYYKMPLFIRPVLYFIYRYIFRFGFLDGKEGLVFHFLQSYWYRFLVDAKIYECKKIGKTYGETGDLKV